MEKRTKIVVLNFQLRDKLNVEYVLTNPEKRKEVKADLKTSE